MATFGSFNFQNLKTKFIFFFIFTTFWTFAQKEANNWYFGYNAGIHFNDDGSVSVLGGSRMRTSEGCSSMSDADGNLVLYSDGRNVWDRNGVLMPNGNYLGGTGLLGDPSSSQSCIVLPKKDNPNIYYVFTVDEPHHQNAAVYPDQFTGTYEEGNSHQTIPDADDGYNNGLNYSVVDLSAAGANGSVGDVVTRNVQLYTYNPAIIDQAKYKCSEKVTAVENADKSGYWIISHFIDTFYAFAVNNAGVNLTPVTSQLAPVVSIAGYRRNAIGCIRASVNGNYVAIAHQQRGNSTGGATTNGVVYLYNFNKATGQLSNPVEVIQNFNPYGIEFSPGENKLYVSGEDPDGTGEVWQYDLTAPDVAASGVLIISGPTGTTMQLGPNGKIYKAINGGAALDVINDPDADGPACNYRRSAVRLAQGTYSVFGLPPFLTSIFSANIIAKSTCMGSATAFSLYMNKAVQSITWDFGDASATSTDSEPNHSYATPGTYNVTANVNYLGGSETVSKTITITRPPVQNPVTDMVICDTDNDGRALITLNDKTPEILGAQNAADFTVFYYTSQENADNNTSPVNAASYTNVTNPQTFYARVVSNINRDCYITTSFQVILVGKPAINVATIALCDDALDGSDTNGMTTFTLAAPSGPLLSGTGFTTSWHGSQNDADNNLRPLSSTHHAANNTTVYVRAVNSTYNSCVYTFPVLLTVRPLPPVTIGATLSQCDPEVTPDGITQFNLTVADTQFTRGNTTYGVSYYPTLTDAQNNTNVIIGTYTNTNPYNDTVTAKIYNTASGCYRLLTLALAVTGTSFPPVTLSACDDINSEDGYSEFNLADAGYETSGNTVTYYSSEQDALMKLNPIPVLFTNTTRNFQAVYARVENNNICLALARINLQVFALPNITVNDTGIVCLNTQEFITLSAGITGSQYRYLWSTGATSQYISVNQPGTYSVAVTNINTSCAKTRTIMVSASNVATITDVVVEDVSEENSITLVALPTGGVSTTYLYSLDAPNGPWQSDPVFTNVSGGIHIVYVYDTNGCGITDKTVGVLQIPKFFTPNADGTNDYWHIPGIAASNYFSSRIYIYDRYGKLLADLKPYDKGWDGDYKGNPLPSTDYWYVITLTDGRVLKGHFSLIR